MNYSISLQTMAEKEILISLVNNLIEVKSKKATTKKGDTIQGGLATVLRKSLRQ